MQNKITIISKRIFKELIQPWKSTKIDDVEFACLKTIVFFNPSKYRHFFICKTIAIENYLNHGSY